MVPPPRGSVETPCVRKKRRGASAGVERMQPGPCTSRVACSAARVGTELVAVLVGLWVGCGGAGQTGDGGHDAGAQTTVDAGGPDGSSDAGSADAGTDGGTPDAGEFDAGGSDAGPDAGAPPDAGNDAGALDAGCGCGPLRCLSDGGCGECADPTDCPAGLPICDPGLSVCLCSAAPNSCLGTTYCDQGTCRPGSRRRELPQRRLHRK